MSQEATGSQTRHSDVLIVDDNPENLKVLGDFFGEQGFNVRVARDGKQALANATAEPPEIILLDIHMPVMDGYETCVALKESPTLRDCPVIFLSALGETFNKVRAFECGGVDYITKPFNLEEVRVRVNNHLQASRLLAESRAGFRASFDQAAVGMAHMTLDGAFQVANSRLCAMLGRDSSDLCATSLAALVHPDSLPVAADALAAAATGKPGLPPIEIACVHSGGATVWCRCNLALVTVGATGKRYIAAIIEDVSEQRRNAAERRRLAAALEQTVEAVAITDLQGVVQYVNHAYEQAFGVRGGEVCGQPLAILSGSAPGYPDTDTIWRAIKDEGAWSGRVQSAEADGRTRTVEYTISPIRDAAGTATNYLAIGRDLTRQLRLEDQLRQSQKMEAIGTLAAGIAHDFNNMLAAIIGFTQLTMEELGEDHKCHRNLGEVLNASGHATELVRQILAFARKTDFEVRPVRLQRIADDVLKLLRRSIPPTVEIHARIDKDCGPVLADATGIHQIIMNLCTNAYHAMEANGGQLTLRVSEVDIDEESSHAGVNVAPGRYVRLDVGDTGHGMDRETAQRIFDPYFTTKDRGKGTGLGLATVHGIVTELNGAIMVYSEPGSGSTFTVFLPAAPGDAEADVATRTPREGARGTERVLFIDDERPLRSFAEKALARLGYQPTTTASPLDALTLVRENPQAFDIVITDEMMPGMRGSELLVALREIRPDLPVILYSGFSESLRGKARDASNFDAYVMKPMVISELSQAIRDVLDTR